jgi:hypothetical protein
MKVNQLRFECRVGNLVFRDNHLAKIIAVSEIGIASEIIQRASQSTNSDTHSRIPLTEEWLVKFAFKRERTRSDIVTDWFIGENPVTMDWMFNIVWIDGCDYPFFKNGYHQIKFVHSLQNLYFALTGQELTLQEEVKP